MHKLHKRFTRNRQILAFFITVMVMLAVGLTLRVSATANLSFVSDFGIKSVSDGTAPFNDNNEPGNDSDDNNGIIRSFDYVNYALSYVTELMPGQKVVEQGKLMTEFELSAPPSAVEFNMDTLNWMLDQKMTYYYTDGTSSDTWDEKKVVSRQVLSGYRLLTVNENGYNAIPGAGSLTVGLHIKAAKNGDTITPKFTIWMEGNDNSLKKSIISNEVKVSAAPRYDIVVVGNSNADYLGYFDPLNGTISTTDKADTMRGRLVGYAFGLRLYNKSADLGLKGIELPKGDFKFDVVMNSKLNDVRVSDDEEYRPFLWDYRENNTANANVKGYLGRHMAAEGHNLHAYRPWSVPGNNNNGNRKQTCWNGGKYSVVQDENNLNVYHVVVRDYDFDLKSLIFPEDGLQNTPSVQFGKNIGFFSVGYLQFIARFPRNINTASTFLVSATAQNMQATSLSGIETTSDLIDNNNSSASNITLYPKGSISQRNYFVNYDSKTIKASAWSRGDSSAFVGERIILRQQARYNGDGGLRHVSILEKFDNNVFKVADDVQEPITFKATSSLSRVDGHQILYAAKPDKTGWVNEEEMNRATEENLVYFDSIQDLNNAGYVCVGYLLTVHGEIIYSGDGEIIESSLVVDVSNSVNNVGLVFQKTGHMRAWREEGEIADWKSYVRPDGSYGLGDSSYGVGEYAPGYIKPTYAHFPTTYTKSAYENGSLVGGHKGGVEYGNSLLIIGAVNSISIRVNDKTTSSTGAEVEKVVYDLDKGERVAEFSIFPSMNVLSENQEDESSNQRADVVITAVVPKKLKYIMGSSSTPPVDITTDSSGAQTITWIVENQKVGEEMPPITFKATIGEAGTANDVNNNDKLSVLATISSGADKRIISASNGNLSETTITVIKLATSSVSKTASPLVEVGGDIHFSLHFGNSDSDVVKNVRAMDILPYNDDGRDSSFSGGYRLKTITLDYINAPSSFDVAKTESGVFASDEEEMRNPNSVETILANRSGETWNKLTGATVNETSKTITYNNIYLDGLAALYFYLGDVQSNGYVNVDLSLTPIDADGELYAIGGKVQQPGDVYSNNFYEFADGQIGIVTSNIVSAQVVHREISGLAWYDANDNGIRDGDESVIAGSVVRIYDQSNMKAKDILGREYESIKTDSQGRYRFDLLPAGNYVVKIEGGDYGLAKKDIGSDDKIDSDATPAVANGTLTTANIAINDLPAANAMLSYHYESENNDAGFTRATLYARKEKKDGSLLAGAKFSFADKTYDASDGMLVIPNLGVGTGTLTETEAPQGYKIAGPWTVRTVVADDGTISASIDGASKNGSAYVLTNYLKDSKIKNKITKSSATTEITKKDQAIDYKIHYDVELTDYMGDAKVSVVDKLPHAIIEDQSELDGGVYDADKLTITWEEDWTSINTYVGANKKSFEYNISLVYDGILGTDRELNNEATGHVTLIDVETEPTNETEPGDEEDDEPTPIRIPGRIITKFIEIGTDKEVCKSDNAVGLIGDPYHTRAKECKDYELVKSPDKEDYNFEENDQIVTYYYRKLENPNTADPITIVASVGLIAFIASFACYRAFHKRR